MKDLVSYQGWEILAKPTWQDFCKTGFLGNMPKDGASLGQRSLAGVQSRTESLSVARTKSKYKGVV